MCSHFMQSEFPGVKSSKHDLITESLTSHAQINFMLNNPNILC